ncbi:FAD-dependent oxidoreductase, partial [Candidatus Sumerlaeota bacterium]|nr:FAD-dependent oxidoreductase [Candidatus Sumerlaeota bacterium]
MDGMNKNPDIIIIGGGIIGCALAESLAAEGLAVTLLDRGLIGREASWAAAGMLAPQSEMPEPGPYMDFCLASRRLYPEVAKRIRAASEIDPQLRTEGMFYVAFTEEDERILRERAAWQKPMGLGVREL